MADKPVSRARERLAVAFAVVVLPLIGFAADYSNGERVLEIFGLTLPAIYILGLIAFAVVSVSRSPSILAFSAGILSLGAATSALVAILGVIPALFILILIFISPWMIVFSAIALSPWITLWALTKVSLSAFRLSNETASPMLVVTSAATGAFLAIAGMAVAATADSRWRSERQHAFDTDDVSRWEQSLRDINANPLCGHRRCLMPVCDQLFRRFGKASGECGSFACPFGFSLAAPNVPPKLSSPFQLVYGYPVSQVCVIGD